MILAVDFDGTIAERKGGPLRMRPGARFVLRELAAAGHDLVLHSVRGSGALGFTLGRPGSGGYYGDPDRAMKGAADESAMFDEMREFLRSEGLWTLDEGGVFRLAWTLPGKPYADRYLEDKADVMGRAGDWERVRSHYVR